MGNKITGMKVKLYIIDNETGKILAGQRNATLSRSADTIDATSKDTEGFWKESLQGFKEWSIDADGCYVTDDEAYSILESAFLNSDNVDVYLEMPSGEKMKGNCSISDFSLEAPYDDLVTYSLSLQGNGALIKIPAEPPKAVTVTLVSDSVTANSFILEFDQKVEGLTQYDIKVNSGVITSIEDVVEEGKFKTKVNMTMKENVKYTAIITKLGYTFNKVENIEYVVV